MVVCLEVKLGSFWAPELKNKPSSFSSWYEDTICEFLGVPEFLSPLLFKLLSMLKRERDIACDRKSGFLFSMFSVCLGHKYVMGTIVIERGDHNNFPYPIKNSQTLTSTWLIWEKQIMQKTWKYIKASSLYLCGHALMQELSMGIRRNSLFSLGLLVRNR